MVCSVSSSLLLGACSDRPSDSEVAVCNSLQRVVDDVAEKDDRGAVAGLARLQEAVEQTENRRLATEGSAFFEQIGRRVDLAPLTVEEIRRIGDETLRLGGDRLAVMIDECREVGAAIERLPGDPG